MCKADRGLRVILASLQSCYLDHARQALFCAQSCYLATLQAWMSVFMHLGLSLIMTNVVHYMCIASVFVLSRGGRGLAGSLAFFLLYLHPPRNFFCTNVPRMGSVVRMVTLGWYAPMFDAFTLPIPPHPPHSMASFPRVCVCSLKEEVLGFYVVTKQVMSLTRERNRNPATIPAKLHI